MTALDPTAQRRLLASARLLDSDNQGEAAAALFAMRRLLPDEVTLGDLVAAALPAVAARAAPASLWRSPDNAMTMRDAVELRRKQPEHRGRVDACLAVLELTDWERNFLASIRVMPTISIRQSATLASLYGKIGGAHARY